MQTTLKQKHNVLANAKIFAINHLSSLIHFEWTQTVQELDSTQQKSGVMLGRPISAKVSNFIIVRETPTGLTLKKNAKKDANKNLEMEKQQQESPDALKNYRIFALFQIEMQKF